VIRDRSDWFVGAHCRGLRDPRILDSDPGRAMKAWNPGPLHIFMQGKLPALQPDFGERWGMAVSAKEMFGDDTGNGSAARAPPGNGEGERDSQDDEAEKRYFTGLRCLNGTPPTMRAAGNVKGVALSRIRWKTMPDYSNRTVNRRHASIRLIAFSTD